MKNVILCKSCHSENPVYGLICSNCKAYLRERIFNVDLWHTLGLLVESPVKAFDIIILAEHKNFIFFISYIVAFKLLIDSMFVSLFTLKLEPIYANFFRNYFIILGELAVVVLLAAFIFKMVTKSNGISTRLKDNFAILIYSLMPHVFGALFLLIIELTIFGGNIFSRNPSPFVLKAALAYILSGFEFLLIAWSIFLSHRGFYSQTKNNRYSFFSALIFNSALYSVVFLNSLLLFN